MVRYEGEIYVLAWGCAPLRGDTEHLVGWAREQRFAIRQCMNDKEGEGAAWRGDSDSLIVALVLRS
jgi:hypothetical protein